MISNLFSRKKQVIPKPPQEPIPSKEVREKKEKEWLSSIRGKGKPKAESNRPSLRLKRTHSNLSPISPSIDLLPEPHSSTLSKKQTIFLSPKKSFASIQSNRSAQSVEALDSYTLISPPSNSIPGKDLSERKSLGKRLEELGVANEQGLIDGEEYRVLRQALFQQNVKNRSQLQRQDGTLLRPGLHSEFTLGPQLSSAYTETSLRIKPTHLAAPPSPILKQRRTGSSDISVLSDSTSTRSVRSSLSAAASLLRPTTKAQQAAQADWQDLNRIQSRDSVTNADLVERIQTPLASEQPILLPPLLLNSNRSLQMNGMRRGTSSPSSASVFSSSTAGRTTLRSRGLSSAGSHHSHGFETDEDRVGDMTSVEIRLEIARLEEEKWHVIRQLESLLTCDATRRQDLSESESNRVSFALSPRVSLIQQRGRSRTATSTSQDSARLSNYSFRSPIKSLLQTPSSVHTLSDYQSPNLADLNFNDFDSPKEYSENEEDKQIREKCTKVREKYDGRLEYFRVRLRGAEIRESLPK